MDERLRFVPRLFEGETMAPLCAEFGISRKTGYKIFDRYKDYGVQAFSDRSHRAHRPANRLWAPLEATIVRVKREDPGWGPPKIREKPQPADVRGAVDHPGEICLHGVRACLQGVWTPAGDSDR
jgi:hypothetical protein